jgi:excisionase family DNA binding protein
MERRFYTSKEIAEILGVSEIWVWRRVRSKELPSYKIGGRRLFKIEEIERWIESQKEEAASK